LVVTTSSHAGNEERKSDGGAKLELSDNIFTINNPENMGAGLI
jgi:hypothetical protein